MTLAGLMWRPWLLIPVLLLALLGDVLCGFSPPGIFHGSILALEEIGQGSQAAGTQ